MIFPFPPVAISTAAVIAASLFGSIDDGEGATGISFANALTILIRRLPVITTNAKTTKTVIIPTTNKDRAEEIVGSIICKIHLRFPRQSFRSRQGNNFHQNSRKDHYYYQVVS